MAIRNKSREELNNQARGFLDHSEKLGMLTNDKKHKILGILCDNSVDIANKDVLRSKLNSIVSDTEFDGLYGEYVDYNRTAVLEFKEFLTSLNLFPIGYEFLVNDLALLLVRWGESLDMLKEDLPREVNEYQKLFKNNIDFLKEKIGIDDRDLGKFISFIVDSDIDYDAVDKNINVFKTAGITSSNDLAKLCVAFPYDDCLDAINLLVNAGIKNVDDFLKLKDLIRYSYLKNIELFVDSGIKSADDLLKLKDIIKLHGDEYSKIIETFKDLGIKNADDFLKLAAFISSPYYVENLKIFVDACVKTADDFLKLKDLILSQRFSEDQRSIIGTLFEAGINKPDDLLKLKTIIYFGNNEKIKLFIGAGIKSVDDLLKLKNLINNFSFSTENIKLFIDAGIKNAEELSSLELFCSNGNIDNVKTIIDAGVKTSDDLLKLKDLIWFGDTKILSILKDMGIKSADDFLKLSEIIGNKNCIANLEILKEAKGVNTADDILQLKYIIKNGYSTILKLFVDAGMSKTDQFLEIEDYIDYGYIENVEENIKSLNKFGILKIDDLLKLKEVIFSNRFAVSKKLDMLKTAKISLVDDVLKLCGYLSGKNFSYFLYELNEIAGETGIKFDDSLFKLSDYVKEIWDDVCNGYQYEVQRNVLFLYYDQGCSIDDIKNYSAVLQSDPEVLSFLFEKYKNISFQESDDLKYVLRSASFDCIKLLFENFENITIKELCDFKYLTNTNEHNLKMILEKYKNNISKDDLVRLSDLIDNSDSDNLEMIFNRYPNLYINDLLKFMNFLRYVRSHNLLVLFNHYPDIDIDTLLGLTQLLSTAYYGNLDTILSSFDLKLSEFDNYINILSYTSSIPDLQSYQINSIGYLKVLDDIAAMDYNGDKKLMLMKKVLTFSLEEAKNYLKIFKMFDASISMDVQRIKNELLEEILKSDNPEKISKAINDIFERNNLPLTGKIFKVFELLYPKKKFSDTLQSHGSPVLHQYLDEGKNVYSLIYKDLMNIAIKSGDRSLKNYINTFIGSKNVLEKFENIVNNGLNGTSLESNGLTELEQEELLYLFRKISVLYDRYYGKEITEGNSIEDKHLGISNISDDQLIAFYQNIKKGFRLKEGESLYNRLQRFLWGLGYHSFEEILEDMNASKKLAHERGLNLYNNSVGGKIEFPKQAFLKGVSEQAFSQIINRGITSREYLGGGETGDAAGSDCTPFDIDGWYTDSFKSGCYGSVNFVIDTKKYSIFNSNENGLGGYTPDKYELFKTGYLSEQHYGIRTGIPMTEVDYIIYTGSSESQYFQNICYQIAKNGYYIPVTDKDGNIKFTPEIFHNIRMGFNYMDYYDGFDVENSNGKYVLKESDNVVHRDSFNTELSQLVAENSPSNEKYCAFAKENRELAENTIKWIQEILENDCGIKFNSKFDSSIVGAELHDSGSTGRGTDIPTKDVDLDFTLILDAKDYERVGEIKRIIHEKIGTLKNDDHEVQEGGNQIKSKINNIGKSESRPNGVPLDLLILKKSQVIDYSSSDAMKEKLDYISRNTDTSVEDLDWIRTNVIIMKKLLKAKGCYKKPEGGIAGIGVENRIIQNHGNFIEALESFEHVAYGGKYEEGKQPLSLFEFQKLYPIYDAGENYKDGCNDNFVDKLKENGYIGTLEIIKAFRLEGIKGIRKIISEYESKKSSFID